MNQEKSPEGKKFDLHEFEETISRLTRAGEEESRENLVAALPKVIEVSRSTFDPDRGHGAERITCAKDTTGLEQYSLMTQSSVDNWQDTQYEDGVSFETLLVRLEEYKSEESEILVKEN